MLKSISQTRELSRKYNIPIEDIILIALNLSGINADILRRRIRFRLKLNRCTETFYLAVCVNTRKSLFSIKDNNLLFNNKPIGIISEKENDAAETSYFRRDKTALTLNSNSRSKCRGCKFCGAYILDAHDTTPLITRQGLTRYFNDILKQYQFKDLSNLKEVAICTRCFITENDTLEHLLMVREVLKNFKFHGELKYIGSHINSEKSLEILEKYAKPFSLYFTLECFTRRKELLRHHKAELTLPAVRRILKSAKDKGFDTAILYILGLDPLEIVIRELKKLVPYLTRFPVINLFQNYIPQHESLRVSEAKDIEYYLKARKEIEKIFIKSNLKPRIWENYRGLWYLTFSNEKLSDINLQTFERGCKN